MLGLVPGMRVLLNVKKQRPGPPGHSSVREMPTTLIQPHHELSAPVRAVRLGPREALFDHRPDGTIYVRSPHALAPYPDKLTERLEYWAAAAPDRTFMAQRDAAGDWRRISYAQTLDQVRRIGDRAARAAIFRPSGRS